MAKEAISKLEEQLQCAVCLDTYSTPKQLQCNHIYCQGCLTNLLVRDQQEQLSLTCPACRQVTPIAEGGVAGLQSAFHINNLLEIHKSLLEANHLVQAKGEGVLEVTSASHIGSYCSEHADEELKLYCKSCEKLICLECIVTGAQHHNHCYETLNKTYSQYRGEITQSLEPLETQISIFNASIAELEMRNKEISNQQGVVETCIHSSAQRLHEIIDIRKMELLKQLDHITQRKLKALSEQKDEIEKSRAQLSYCLDTIKQTLETQKVKQVLMIKNKLLEQVRELIGGFQDEVLKPHVKADIIFSAALSRDIQNLIEKYGQVFEGETRPVPSKCYATGSGLVSAAVKQKATVVVQSISSHNEPCVMPLKALECELVSEITGNTYKCDIQKRGHNEYDISYTPVVKGKNQLHIKVYGRHIKESPFHLSITSSIEALNIPLSSISTVKRPWAAAIGQEGHIIVTESGNNRISILTSNGKKVRSFGTRGSGEGQFNSPRGVAVDGDGNILVADSSNHRIQKFTPDGTFLAAVGKKTTRMHLYIPGPWTPQSTPLLFTNPKAVAYNAHNSKVYVLDESFTIQILNTDFSFYSSFKFNRSVGLLYDCPGTLVCDSHGNVYVADARMTAIQVFTAEGELLRSFNGEKWKLTFPVSIAIDANDHIYIGEHIKHRICVCTPEGNIVKSFNDFGEDTEEFVISRGLVVDNCGVLYVCNYDDDLISVF